MDLLVQQAAQIALRLAALPPGGLRCEGPALDAIEQLALQILKEVSAIRVGKSRSLGESSGAWPVMQPVLRR